MTTKGLALIFGFVLYLPSLVAGAMGPIVNLVDIPVPEKLTGGPLSIQDVQTIIEDGCRHSGWLADIPYDGSLRATFNHIDKTNAKALISCTAAAILLHRDKYPIYDTREAEFLSLHSPK